MTPKVMSITDAIYACRSVQAFMPEPLPDATVHALIYAAVQAPAHHAAPWAFVVIKDETLLKALSLEFIEISVEQACLFQNAGAVIVIYGRVPSPFVDSDCWLAAGNIALAARGMGLGTCFLRDALPCLNTPGWKRSLDVPEQMTAVAPIALGRPMTEDDAFRPPPPDILCWAAAR